MVCQYPWLRSCTTLKRTTHRPGCGTAAQEHVAEFNQWTARRTGRQVVQCDTGMPPRHPTWRVTPKVAESTKAYCSKLAPRKCLENLSFTSCQASFVEPVKLLEAAPGGFPLKLLPMGNFSWIKVLTQLPLSAFLLLETNPKCCTNERLMRILSYRQSPLLSGRMILPSKHYHHSTPT